MLDIIEIGARIKIEREMLGFTLEEFGFIGGYDFSYQTAIECGSEHASGNYLSEISKVGADIGFLMTGNKSFPDLSWEEKMLLERMRTMSEQEKSQLLDMMQLKT